MNAEPFDFRKPPPGGLEGHVTRWLTEACESTPQSWAGLLPFPARLRLDKLETVTTATALHRLPEDICGLKLAVADFPDETPLLALSRPLLLALVGGALGEVPSVLPADRPPTPVEDALIDLLVQQLFFDPLQNTWPASQRLRLSIVARGAPRKIVALPPNDLILLVSFMVNGPFDDQNVVLLLPRSGPVPLLTRTEVAPPPKPFDRGQMAALVCEMSAEFSVILGTADVPLNELRNLEQGDLVILNQRASEPLAARVAGIAKYRVWPGAVGRRRGVQVEGRPFSPLPL